MEKVDIRRRLLRLMMALLEHPFGYTKQQLARLCQVSTDTIERDLDALDNAGFTVCKNDNRCYAFAGEKPLKQLKELVYFNEDEQNLLAQAIDHFARYMQRAQAEKLKRKVVDLYDYRRLGFAHLRRPYLDKIGLLRQSVEEKRQVTLVNYHSSNSNRIGDRRVECFLVLPPEDILQAYDLDRQELRHFRLSRVGRVEFLPQKWAYEHHHQIRRTDPFRIVDDNQVWVHLRLKVGAYNELIERFPATLANTFPAADEPDVYDFQCNVNRGFLGLTNFILGFYHQLIEVVTPDSLIEHLRAEVERMRF